jgi:hypothetical protein
MGRASSPRPLASGTGGLSRVTGHKVERDVAPWPSPRPMVARPAHTLGCGIGLVRRWPWWPAASARVRARRGAPADEVTGTGVH